MALPDVLQWIALGRKTGSLHVRRGATETRILFRDGSVFSSWSNDPRHSLGQYLIRDRRVNEEQLFKALLAQERGGGLIGSILVAEGVLAEDDLRQTLAFKAEETLYDLFLWTEGDFEFMDGTLPDDVRIHLKLPVTAVILEGIRRVDEWARIREVFPSLGHDLQGARRAARRERRGRAAGAGPGRVGQVAGRDQPGDAALRVRDGRPALRASLARRCWPWTVRASRRRARTRWERSGSCWRWPRQRLSEKRFDAALRSLRGRAGHRPAQPARQEGPDRGGRRARRASARCAASRSRRCRC